jgi:hypothetical protein
MVNGCACYDADYPSFGLRPTRTSCEFRNRIESLGGYSNQKFKLNKKTFRIILQSSSTNSKEYQLAVRAAQTSRGRPLEPVRVGVQRRSRRLG